MAEIVVAIPVRDEAERIGACLWALNEQTRRPDAVVLLLNNCTDGSAMIARRMRQRLGFRLLSLELTLPGPRANAGHARRMAMELAARRCGHDGVLMSTDADAIAPRDWIARNQAAIAQGADAVCGRAVMDTADLAALPSGLRNDLNREATYITLLDRLACALDPEPHDPWPRHTEASGASLAVRANAFARAGGIPALPSGEDRAFVRALWEDDARIRHAPDVQVIVSGRQMGRAAGGMADTLHRRMVDLDMYADTPAEPAANAFRRYELRRRCRLAHSGAWDATLAGDLQLPAATLMRCMAASGFGAAWAGLEAASPGLLRNRVRFSDLSRQTGFATALLAELAEPETMAAD